MARSNTGKILVATGYLDGVAEFSLHDDDPGTTGVNELVGGSPAYGRIARPDFTVSGTGASQLLASFAVGAGDQVKFAGMWDASGNFLEGGAVAPTGVYSEQGNYDLVINVQGA